MHRNVLKWQTYLFGASFLQHPWASGAVPYRCFFDRFCWTTTWFWVIPGSNRFGLVSMKYEQLTDQFSDFFNNNMPPKNNARSRRQLNCCARANSIWLSTFEAFDNQGQCFSCSDTFSLPWLLLPTYIWRKKLNVLLWVYLDIQSQFNQLLRKNEYCNIL